MAGLKDDAQWIVLMGFIVSFSLFFLAIVLNQSTVVGQTTAEAVSEFPKEDIRGVRNVVIQSIFMDNNDPNPSVYNNKSKVQEEIRILSRTRQDAVVNFTLTQDTTGTFTNCKLYYNNGVTAYYENYTFPS